MPEIAITTFRWVPPVAQGLVRDLRVRWALEEAGLPYRVKLIGFEDQSSQRHRALQPFGQVPVYEEDGLVLFESGAIVHHIAQRTDALMPTDPRGRARTLQWMFAALNSVEPAVMNLMEVDFFAARAEWAQPRRPAVIDFLKSRLARLSTWLEGREYLEDRFTAGDLLMATVLQILRHTDIVKEMPVLDAYHLRCTSRPAYKKALHDQLRVFEENAPR